MVVLDLLAEQTNGQEEVCASYILHPVACGLTKNAKWYIVAKALWLSILCLGQLNHRCCSTFKLLS